MNNLLILKLILYFWLLILTKYLVILKKSFNPEKFAKLIIKECVNIINDIDEDDDRERGLHATRWAIQHYFEEILYK